MTRFPKIYQFLIMYLGVAHSAMADQKADALLRQQREQVIVRYVLDLQQANYQDISQLFVKDGIVVSTSRGEVKAQPFFYSFLSNVTLAKTELHQVFSSYLENHRYAARFHFSFKLKDGETGNGEYMDEFVFKDASIKLATVYMFENLKFGN